MGKLDMTPEQLAALHVRQLAEDNKISTASCIEWLKGAPRRIEDEPIIDAIIAQLLIHDALEQKYQDLVAWADKQSGTPCEQIRHKYLREENAELLLQATENGQKANMLHKLNNELLEALQAALSTDLLPEVIAQACEAALAKAAFK